MPRRERRTYGIPPPFHPLTGKDAALQRAGVFPWCAMMQIAESDAHADYVVCRGFDTRIGKFIDYPPGISVAKPYGNRTTGRYTVGQVFPAFLPTQGLPGYVPPSPTSVDWRVGQNAGTASPTAAGGHPSNLSSSITEMVDDNGVAVQWILADSAGKSSGTQLLWGVAKTNWNNNGSDCPSVDVNQCEDCEGTNPDPGTTHTVFLPRTANQHPNVIAGDVIGYEAASDGTYCCVSDYLDDKIGTVKFWAAVGGYPPGWAIMDGSENSVANGGTGVNALGRFIRAAENEGEVGLTGGSLVHTHRAQFTIEPHKPEDIGSAISINIPDHTIAQLAHQHKLIATPSGDLYDTGSTQTIDVPPDCTLEPVQPNFDAIAGATCLTDTHLWGPLKHSEVTIVRGDDPYLDHVWTPVTVEEVPHIPEYVKLVPIERIDNSS